MMTNPREAYEELSDWVDVSSHPDKSQFDSLLSNFVQSVVNVTIEETRKEANSGTEHIGLIQESVNEKEYERFFESD
jgi:hypothetical protein